MRAYEDGGHAYHATMPTDTLAILRDAMEETESTGLGTLKARQWDLGNQVRALFNEAGFRSVAAEGFEAPGVVVLHTDNIDIHNTRLFRDQGIQTAAGVPMMCDEPENFRSFRVGLFGLEKLNNIDRTVDNLRQALAAIGPTDG